MILYSNDYDRLRIARLLNLLLTANENGVRGVTQEVYKHLIPLITSFDIPNILTNMSVDNGRLYLKEPVVVEFLHERPRPDDDDAPPRRRGT